MKGMHKVRYLICLFNLCIVLIANDCVMFRISGVCTVQESKIIRRIMKRAMHANQVHGIKFAPAFVNFVAFFCFSRGFP